MYLAHHLFVCISGVMTSSYILICLYEILMNSLFISASHVLMTCSFVASFYSFKGFVYLDPSQGFPSHKFILIDLFNIRSNNLSMLPVSDPR